MPELPEVETVRRGLLPYVINAEVLDVQLNRSNLRFNFPVRFSEKLQNLTITNIDRRGKYLLFYFSDLIMLSHLGMSGSWRLVSDNDFISNKNPKHDHLVIFLRDTFGKTIKLIYNDPRRFGFIDLFAKDELHYNKFLQYLGVEPLSNDLNGRFLIETFANKKQNLKAALLDQTIIAGLGNIYVCEALFMTGLSPLRSAFTISQDISICDKLTESIKFILEKSLQSGGSSLRDYVHSDGSLGYFQNELLVYDREGKNCYKCNNIIQRVIQSGRSSFYCHHCQQ
ncbi:bifunctional DNA-formamidopyrimidine glycosylase/DNA-(apurinic or apyrimidinic site) lyase [Bartonella sp. DGB1]|uniref:bifunctional DNA-formamidopyrimidine glycosylase/DNA-(apurinic or apyrimidinic site) lyase n=1 Tax=Bartonella sp. DGB1 TaxID=3239807 RepID=UPI0035240DF4